MCRMGSWFLTPFGGMTKRHRVRRKKIHGIEGLRFTKSSVLKTRYGGIELSSRFKTTPFNKCPVTDSISIPSRILKWKKIVNGRILQPKGTDFWHGVYKTIKTSTTIILWIVLLIRQYRLFFYKKCKTDENMISKDFTFLF